MLFPIDNEGRDDGDFWPIVDDDGWYAGDF